MKPSEQLKRTTLNKLEAKLNQVEDEKSRYYNLYVKANQEVNDIGARIIETKDAIELLEKEEL